MLMRYAFASPFKEAIRTLIAEKQALGFIYTAVQYRLAEFDRFCCAEFPDETRLTQAVVQRWAEFRPQEHPNNRALRVSSVRQLADYLQRAGHDAYTIPYGTEGRRIRYVPHIFTQTELHAFFRAADRQHSSAFSPTRHLVMPVLFRVLYCCGLRPAEAANLCTDDVDWERGCLYLRQAKGHKDRVVPLSTDLWALCRAYDTSIRDLLPRRHAFFPNRYGNSLDPSTFDDWFHQLWDDAGIAHVSGNPPRLYDFRHTFCVHRLNRWVREGQDVHALLPYLSRYLGHTSLAMTDYYLHVVPEFFTDIQRLSKQGLALIPEVPV